MMQTLFERLRATAARIVVRQADDAPAPSDRDAAAPADVDPPVAANRDAPPTLARMSWRWRVAGWALIGVFVVGGITWAATAPLDSAAVAQGVVAVESNRKSVAHLEGGIVREILVREGQTVAAGEPLVRIDDTHSQATRQLLRARLAAARLRKARLIAERDGAAEIDFPADLLAREDEPKIAELIAGERSIFETRRDNQSSQEQILAERIAKTRSEIRGLEAQRAAERQRAKLLGEELAMMQQLLTEGLALRNKVLSLQRDAAETKGLIGELTARIARAEESIAEIRMQQALPREGRLKEASQQLQDTNERIAELGEQLRAAEDVLARTVVRAPTGGRVVGLAVHTPGGIVQPGQPLLDIVPDKDRFVVDARIAPRDIDMVRENMTAEIRLTAFNARTTPMLGGRVLSVSADRMVDEATGRPYFAARILPEPTDASGAAGAADAAWPLDLSTLSPGMQAEVFLIAERRTVLDYLIEPVLRSLRRAGREA